MAIIGGSVVGYRSVAYSGPGDIVSGAIGWWGLRAYSNATIGNNAIRLREDGGNTEQDFATIAEGGLDLAAIATFKGANNLFVVKLYDQTGNGNDVAQTIAGIQPPFTLNQFGTLPGLFQTVSKNLISTTAASQAQPYSVAAVFDRTGVDGGASAVGSIGAIDSRLIAVAAPFGGPAETCGIFAGASLSSSNDITDNALQSTIGVFDGASSVVNLMGTETTGNASTSPGDGIFHYGGDGFGNWFDKGYVQELGWWPVALTGGQRSSMAANQRAYWGF
jgi:hypothetical protein